MPAWTPPPPSPRDWPTLPHEDWGPTLALLHRWSQVLGKVRMACGPWLNHSWGVALYVTARGLGTSLVPFGSRAFELELDLVDHRVVVVTANGDRRDRSLDDLTVAAFHRWVLDALAGLELPVEIDPVPSEIADAVPFPDDVEARPYDPAHAHVLWQALVQVQRVFTRFRAGFLGKASPVHVFWGSFDLAVTRFSGRPAPPHPGGLPNFPVEVAREAYSHEVTSAGFWPGDADTPPIFYAYAYPTPDGYADAEVAPASASWLADLGEFALPYDDVRAAADPDETLSAFLESTHAAAADLAGWDRAALECVDPRGPDWWRSRPHGGV